MSSHPAFQPASTTTPWWGALAVRREFWGGIALVTVWLGVLFVGVFGGNIETRSTDGSGSSFPVVVVVALVALAATVSIGRWAFGGGRRDA